MAPGSEQSNKYGVLNDYDGMVFPDLLYFEGFTVQLEYFDLSVASYLDKT